MTTFTLSAGQASVPPDSEEILEEDEGIEAEPVAEPQPESEEASKEEPEAEPENRNL